MTYTCKDPAKADRGTTKIETLEAENQSLRAALELAECHCFCALHNQVHAVEFSRWRKNCILMGVKCDRCDALAKDGDK